mmetsp:Transcript_7047/g.29047  ORF Transcript_7047/g.29047 Transcript_7047/m.29047 type:complete len:252 (+) Transcript_7047:1702-2457(+)
MTRAAVLERVRQVLLRARVVVVEHRESTDVVRVRHFLRAREGLEARERRQVHRRDQVLAQVQRVEFEVDLEQAHHQEQRRALLLLHRRVGGVPVHQHQQSPRVVQLARLLAGSRERGVRALRQRLGGFHQIDQRIQAPRGLLQPEVLDERLRRGRDRRECVLRPALRDRAQTLAVEREHLVVRLGQALLTKRPEVHLAVLRQSRGHRAHRVRVRHVKQARELRAVLRAHRRARGIEVLPQRRHRRASAPGD